MIFHPRFYYSTVGDNLPSSEQEMNWRVSDYFNSDIESAIHMHSEIEAKVFGETCYIPAYLLLQVKDPQGKELEIFGIHSLSYFIEAFLFACQCHLTRKQSLIILCAMKSGETLTELHANMFDIEARAIAWDLMSQCNARKTEMESFNFVGFAP